MKKKILFLVIVMAITVFAFVPFINVDASSIGFLGSGKIVTFNQTATDSESVSNSTNMETYINAKKDEFAEALTNASVAVDLSKSNIDPNNLFSTTEPYKYAVISNISSGYQMIESTLTQTYTVSYTLTNVTMSASSTPITSANVTLKAPKVGDKVEKITKNDGYGDYETQSTQPTVSTTTEGLVVNAFWVKGLENLSEESFYGTFEEDTYYYALIDFEAEEGYELPSTFPDGIKINGQTPDEVFAVMGGKWNHCVAKIKATTEETSTTYEFIDNTANQTYTVNPDDTLSFRINADYSLFENGGAVYIDGTETTEYTSKSGSTIITLNKDFVNSLSVGEHTLKVAFNNGGEATTKFTIEKAEETTNTSTTDNPQTGDNILFYISMLGLSIISLASVGIYTKKKRFN